MKMLRRGILATVTFLLFFYQHAAISYRPPVLRALIDRFLPTRSPKRGTSGDASREQFLAAGASPESELGQNRIESSLLDPNLNFPGSRFFCLGQLQSQHAVLEIGGYFGLVDCLVQLELAKKID